MKANAPQVDPQTIEKAKAGDESAFAKIYDRWAQPVYNFIYQKVDSKHSAEDLTAETFLNAWKAIGDFEQREEAKFSTWLYQIARNTVTDYYRTREKGQASMDEIPQQPEDTFGSVPETELTDRQEKLKSAFDQLKDNHKKVLELRYFEEKEVSEVAQIMQKKKGAVRTLTHRALKALREAMGETENE